QISLTNSLAEYGEQKSCAVTTARRLTHFLGDIMVKDKGLRCQYVIACEPQGTRVSERAGPVAIFETDPGSELLDYISESSTMSKSLAEYGEQKSCAVLDDKIQAYQETTRTADYKDFIV
ncbi:DNA polymerase epsilon catalytic subunit A-like protein, partial [Tanacetum coccineum]